MEQEILYKNTFNKNFDDSDTQSFLKKISTEYPYFGLSHYYTLKASNKNLYDYEKIAQKTAVFFNTPYLLQYNLNEIQKKGSSYNEATIIEPIQHNILINDEQSGDDQITKKPIILEEIETIAHIADIKDEALLFEPLHATDYFASQGIKYSQLNFTNDKLGNQLKSFTSWLKTMKKVHPDKLAPVNIQLEAAIQKQAAKSNLDTEIVTEPMAEALLKQGKQIRAIELYEKLSLLNPTKSAYFAAKIDHLNK